MCYLFCLLCSYHYASAFYLASAWLSCSSSSQVHTQSEYHLHSLLCYELVLLDDFCLFCCICYRIHLPLLPTSYCHIFSCCFLCWSFYYKNLASLLCLISQQRPASVYHFWLQLVQSFYMYWLFICGLGRMHSHSFHFRIFCMSLRHFILPVFIYCSDLSTE